MIKYEYFDGGKLLICKFSGVIEKSALVGFLEFIHTRTDDHSLSMVINDFRESTVKIDADNVKEVADMKLNYLKNKTYTSHIVNDPMGTAISILIESSDMCVYQVCSTTEACISFLKLNIGSHELQKRINNLKYTYTVGEKPDSK